MIDVIGLYEPDCSFCGDWDPREFREMKRENFEKLTQETLNAMKTIVEDNLTRIQRSPKDITALQKGIYYATEYAQLLRAHAETNLSAKKRFDYLVRKDLFFYGWAPKFFRHLFLKNPHSGALHPISYQFTVKKRTQGLPALRAILQGPAFLTSGGVVKIASLMALHAMLGQKKFEALCEVSPLCPAEINTYDAVSCLYEQLPTVDGPLAVGDQVFIKGFAKYPDKHPYGLGGSYHVICIKATPSQEKFIGLGIPPSTLSEIQLKLVKAYNQDPAPLDLFSSKHRRSTPEELRKHRISTRTLRRSGGGKITAIRRLHRERLLTFVNNTPSKVKAYVKEWIAERGTPKAPKALLLRHSP